jgi:hypothetical protein
MKLLRIVILRALFVCTASLLAGCQSLPSQAMSHTELRGLVDSVPCDVSGYYDSDYPVLRTDEEFLVEGSLHTGVVELIMNEPEFVRFAEYNGRQSVVICAEFRITHLCGPDRPRPSCFVKSITVVAGGT